MFMPDDPQLAFCRSTARGEHISRRTINVRVSLEFDHAISCPQHCETIFEQNSKEKPSLSNPLLGSLTLAEIECYPSLFSVLD